MYFLKTKGSNTVTEYFQLRDEDFALVEYFKLSLVPKMAKSIIEKYGLQTAEKDFVDLVGQSEYNKLIRI